MFGLVLRSLVLLQAAVDGLQPEFHRSIGKGVDHAGDRVNGGNGVIAGYPPDLAPGAAIAVYRLAQGQLGVLRRVVDVDGVQPALRRADRQVISGEGHGLVHRESRVPAKEQLPGRDARHRALVIPHLVRQVELHGEGLGLLLRAQPQKLPHVDLHGGGHFCRCVSIVIDQRKEGLAVVHGGGQLGVGKGSVVQGVAADDQVPQVLLLGQVQDDLHHGGGLFLAGSVILGVFQVHHAGGGRGGVHGGEQLGHIQRHAADLAVGLIGVTCIGLHTFAAEIHAAADFCHCQPLTAAFGHLIEEGLAVAEGAVARVHGGQGLAVRRQGQVFALHRLGEFHRDGHHLAVAVAARRGGDLHHPGLCVVQKVGRLKNQSVSRGKVIGDSDIYIKP